MGQGVVNITRVSTFVTPEDLGQDEALQALLEALADQPVRPNDTYHLATPSRTYEFAPGPSGETLEHVRTWK